MSRTFLTMASQSSRTKLSPLPKDELIVSPHWLTDFFFQMPIIHSHRMYWFCAVQQALFGLATWMFFFFFFFLLRFKSCCSQSSLAISAMLCKRVLAASIWLLLQASSLSRHLLCRKDRSFCLILAFDFKRYQVKYPRGECVCHLQFQ